MIGADHFGFSISGAAAEFFVAKPAWLHRLPEQLSWTMGALVEPFSVAYYALVRAGGVDASDTVAVLGAGPIGLAVAAAAERDGRPDRRRRAVARAAGGGAASSAPPHAVAAGARPRSCSRELTDGRGADVVVEASGRPAVMAQALELVAFQGRVAYIGIDVGREAPAKLGLIQSKELRITGSIGSPGVWPETLRFLAGVGHRPLPAGHPAVRRRRGAGRAGHRPPPVAHDHQGARRVRRDPLNTAPGLLRRRRASAPRRVPSRDDPGRPVLLDVGEEAGAGVAASR